MRFLSLATCATFAALLASPALAHHPLEGLAMETFGHGALSGVGHPILGFDHLFFVLAMGAAAALAGCLMRGVLAYIAAMLAGCLLISLGGSLPVQEVLVAASLVTLGLLIASQKHVPQVLLVSVFAAFGLFHGAAFGGSIIAQEGGAPIQVLVGYLLGLGLTQTLLALAAGFATSRLRPVTARLGGAMVAGAGMLLCLELLEGAILS